jgi:hypothetical protein
MQQSKNSVYTNENMYAMFYLVMIMLMGIVGEAVLRLNATAHQTDST